MLVGHYKKEHKEVKEIEREEEVEKEKEEDEEFGSKTLNFEFPNRTLKTQTPAPLSR